MDGRASLRRVLPPSPGIAQNADSTHAKQPSEAGSGTVEAVSESIRKAPPAIFESIAHELPPSLLIEYQSSD